MPASVKVLLVDDEPDIREVAVLSLQLDAAFEVQALGSAGEALDFLARDVWRPDIILLDVMMAGLDGPAALRMLRSIPAAQDTPVAFMTARTRDADVARFLAEGAIAVLPKPFNPLTLAQQVRALLPPPPTTRAGDHRSLERGEDWRARNEGMWNSGE